MSTVAKKPAAAPMSEAVATAFKKRYRLTLLVSALCVFVAFGGVYGHITLHQAWGLPLFLLAMIAGFGTQIAFIVALAKASRLEKRV